MTEDQLRLDLRDSMIDSLINLGEDHNIIILLSDSTSTSKITPFKEKYPEQVIDVGIAEQNLVGVAAGLSLGGYISITASAASFLVSRANEQIKNDVCYSNTNVKLVGLNAGVCYGPLAGTHHAIDDISIMRGLGNILVLAPADPVETDRIFRFAVNYKGPVYIRMDNAKFPVIHQPDYRFELGKVDILMEGDDLSIFATGSVVHEAFFAARELAEESIYAEVLNISSIRPVDRQAIAASISRTGKVITVEEHSLHGGLGGLIAEVIADSDLTTTITRLGIPDGQFSIAGPRDEIRAYYNIDKNGIEQAAKTLLSND